MSKNLCEATKLSNFVPIPINLLHMDLSSSTVLVYGFLLSRGLLSAKNGWTDDGKAYVRYSNKQLIEDTGLGLTTIKNALLSLEKKELIVRAMTNKRDRKIFLLVPEESVVVGKKPFDGTKSIPRVSQKTDHHTGGNLTTNICNENSKRNNKYDCEEGESF